MLRCSARCCERQNGKRTPNAGKRIANKVVQTSVSWFGWDDVLVAPFSSQPRGVFVGLRKDNCDTPCITRTYPLSLATTGTFLSSLPYRRGVPRRSHPFLYLFIGFGWSLSLSSLARGLTLSGLLLSSGGHAGRTCYLCCRAQGSSFPTARRFSSNEAVLGFRSFCYPFCVQEARCGRVHHQTAQHRRIHNI